MLSHELASARNARFATLLFLLNFFFLSPHASEARAQASHGSSERCSKRAAHALTRAGWQSRARKSTTRQTVVATLKNNGFTEDRE